MKLNKRILKEMIREALNEENEVPAEVPKGTLTTGPAVTGTGLRTKLRDIGTEIAADVQAGEVTAQETKIINKFMDILNLGATELKMDEGRSFNILTRVYRVLAKHLGQEIKGSREETPTEETPTEETPTEGGS